MIKNFKIFENITDRKKNWIKDIEEYHRIESSKIDSVDILDYVRFFHDIEDEEGDDFYERIVEEHDYFVLKWIEIDDIENRYEFYTNKGIIKEYAELYEKEKTYPPPVLNWELNIIDGAHRIRALMELGLKEIKCYVGQKNLFEKYTIENQYDEIFGVPKTKQQKEYKRRWIEEMKKNSKKYDLKNSEEEVKRMALTGEQSPFYRTMESTYKDAPEHEDQDLLDFYKSKNKVRTKEDINRMLSWYKQQKKAKHKTPEPNYYGKEQDQIPSNKSNSKQTNMTGSGCR